MATATPRLLKKAASLLIICAVMWTGDGNAQAPIKFNTDEAPANKDTRSPLIFKDGAASGNSAPPKPSEMDNSVPEDAPFKTYIGYPKYQIGPTVALLNTSAVWSYSGIEYNFSSSSTAYGAQVRILGTPQVKMEFDYQHYTVATDAATSSLANILQSEVDIDTYFLKTSFCLIGDSSFFRQFCPGVDIGHDAYPVLKFQDGTNLILSSTKDIVVGLNLAYQIPFSEKFLTRFKVGLNYGTGMGNKGVLTSKKNSSYFASLAPEWAVARNHSIVGNVEYKVRKAELEGYVNPTLKDMWSTDASTLSLLLGYLYTF